ncbi:hypothetical protein Mgra_00003802 [Meloidogyne graminicola]|uniref:CLAVATA3/ESR (CLE)-related protein n=1 Tax=Meloidogyne graminicola TaxID=189291 RepID=A0A8S9ZTH2_9BILA|nr:hypothetical protein Mgra_00003802 [Meloidogyne graminicola]
MKLLFIFILISLLFIADIITTQNNFLNADYNHFPKGHPPLHNKVGNFKDSDYFNPKHHPPRHNIHKNVPKN